MNKLDINYQLAKVKSLIMLYKTRLGLFNDLEEEFEKLSNQLEEMTMIDKKHLKKVIEENFKFEPIGSLSDLGVMTTNFKFSNRCEISQTDYYKQESFWKGMFIGKVLYCIDNYDYESYIH